MGLLQGDGRRRRGSGTRLTQREVFSGLLAPLVGGWLDRTTLPAFTAMNEALRNRVEQSVRSPLG